MEVVVARIAGLDVHKETVMACVRAPGEAGKRRQVVREFSTFTAELVQLKDWLAAEGVTQVVMEATGVYWRPVWARLRGGAGLGADVGERPAREEPAGAQDRPVNRTTRAHGPAQRLTDGRGGYLADPCSTRTMTRLT